MLSNPKSNRNTKTIKGATEEPDYFGFYSPDLEGFTGIGHSLEDCLFKAKGKKQGQILTINYWCCQDTNF
jgi:hypothetical protein